MKLHVTHMNPADFEDNACGACGGTGYQDDYGFEQSRPDKCGACHGTGVEA